MRTIKTFIVEDSPVILENLVGALEEMTSVQVVGSAPDEPTAMSRLRQLDGDIDLAIVDIVLSVGSGLGVLRGAHASGLKTKRVVLTNYATAEMRARCHELGVDGIFDKSNELDALVSYCIRLGDDQGPAAPGALN